MMQNDLGIRTVGEIFEEIEAEEKLWLAEPKPHYGKVYWNRKNNTIELFVYHNGKSAYEIDLDRCKTTNQVCDWIFHLMEKTWREGIMFDLIKMFRKILPHKILYHW